MKRFIKAAETQKTSAQEALDQELSEIKDNFNYGIDGLDKLAADGYLADAKEIADEMKSNLELSLSKIAAIIAK